MLPRAHDFVRGILITVFGAAIWMGSASTVQATCGDYLEHHSTAAQREAHHSGDADRKSAGSVAEKPSETPCRCRGASCSRGSELPARPPTRTITLIEQWAWLEARLNRTSPSKETRLIDYAVELCSGEGLGILRPPR